MHKTIYYTELPAQCLALAASASGSVLLHTARPDADNYRSYLFVRPTQILPADERLFSFFEQALAKGAWIAGFFSYECGEGLRDLKRQLPDLATPLAWFGVYADPIIFNHRTGEFERGAPDQWIALNRQNEGFEISDPHLSMNELSYAKKIAVIQEYIRSGDTYQVNFTDRLQFGLRGSAEAMFRALAENQPVPYAAFLRADAWHILSFSPELFFRVRGRRIVTCPMKGTAPRGADTAEDEMNARWLRSDIKNRSENVMIVDLLRNDLGRICEYGSVRVEQLFTVEKYKTLFQMTSRVSGTLRADISYAEIFGSLFPCGSVTGAPKHRTLEIIGELESAPRGVYTGAIGFFSPHGEAVFSVPIRTLVLKDGRGAMGVGSGIVIDSNAQQEYRECLVKSEFLTSCKQPFQLIETILWDDGYQRLPAHVDRLQSSAEYFGFALDHDAVLAALEEESSRIPRGCRSKVRLLLARSGAITVTHSPLEEQASTGEVMISDVRLSSTDRFLRHKTTRRQLYDEQYALARAQGCDDVLFFNERSELTEGAISNVFLEKDGRRFTPPVSCGLLPGIYRAYLLESELIAERVIMLDDLLAADAVYICNAVRGCRKVQIKSEESRPALLDADPA